MHISNLESQVPLACGGTWFSSLRSLVPPLRISTADIQKPNYTSGISQSSIKHFIMAGKISFCHISDINSCWFFFFLL